MARDHDLTPIGAAGDVTRFNRRTHQPIAGSAISDGTQVEVVRPGYVWHRPGEGDVQIAKAVVEEHADTPGGEFAEQNRRAATQQTARAAAAAQERAARRTPAVARVLDADNLEDAIAAIPRNQGLLHFEQLQAYAATAPASYRPTSPEGREFGRVERALTLLREQLRRQGFPMADERAAPPAAPAGDTAAARAQTALRGASVERLLEVAADLAAQPPSDTVNRALEALDAELARREGLPDLVETPNPHADRIDDLVGRGWSYTDAYAEVHGLDPTKLTREQRMSIVDAGRRPGETRTTAIRRMYREYVYMQWNDAEEATRGNLLTPAARRMQIDPISLWSGTATRARKYASDELKQWWEDHGGRVTFTQWSAQFTGDTAAAEAARLAGSGRDFGI